MDINKLKNKENELVKELRSMLTGAENESRDLNEVEAKKFNEVEGKVAEIRAKIERFEKVEKLEESLSKPVESRAEVKVEVTSNAGEAKRVKEEHRKAFANYLVGKPLSKSEVRALEVGTASEGGNIVPTDFQDELSKRLRVLNPFREVAKVLNLDRAMDIPVHSTHSAAAIRAEEADVNGSTSDVAFGKETLNYFEIYHEVVFSRELKMQSAIDLEGFLLDELAQAIAYKEEELIVSGSGSGQTAGLDVISAVGGVNVGTVEQGASASGTVSIDQLINIYYSMNKMHRRNGIWVMSDNTHKYLMQLAEVEKSTVGTPADMYGYDYNKKLLISDLLNGPAEKLLGNDVFISDHMGDLDGDNTVSIALFDPRNMYIADFGGMKVDKVDGDLTLARQGQEAIVAHKGMDMVLNSPDALVQFHNEDTT